MPTYRGKGWLIPMHEWFLLLRWILFCMIEFAGYVFVVIGFAMFMRSAAHTINHVEAEQTLNIGLVLILVGRQLRNG